MEKEYLSTTQVAEILGMSRVAVFKKIKRGGIPARKIGRNYAIAREDISPALSDTVTAKQKKFINESTTRVVKEYGEALKRLAKE